MLMITTKSLGTLKKSPTILSYCSVEVLNLQGRGNITAEIIFEP